MYRVKNSGIAIIDKLDTRSRSLLEFIYNRLFIFGSYKHRDTTSDSASEIYLGEKQRGSYACLLSSRAGIE